MHMNAKIKATRCPWVTADPIYLVYHDQEWGVPIYDDHRLFENVILESMQAGLSWLTILKKRDAFRECFDYFNAEKIARYDAKKIAALLQDARIVRHEKKIQATIENAKAYLHIQQTQGSFAQYLWRFTDGKPQQNAWQQAKDVPTRTVVSDKMAKQLRQDGFRFIGSLGCYALMQAIGMVNDHLTTCFCYHRVRRLG